MQRDVRALLIDVKKAAAEIRQFINGMEFGDCADDIRTQKAAAFHCALTGDALNRLEQAAPGQAPRIPQLRQIVGFRNLLVHDYTGLSQSRVCHSTAELHSEAEMVDTLVASSALRRRLRPRPRDKPSSSVGKPVPISRRIRTYAVPPMVFKSVGRRRKRMALPSCSP